MILRPRTAEEVRAANGLGMIQPVSFNYQTVGYLRPVQALPEPGAEEIDRPLRVDPQTPDLVAVGAAGGTERERLLAIAVEAGDKAAAQAAILPPREWSLMAILSLSTSARVAR